MDPSNVDSADPKVSNPSSNGGSSRKRPRVTKGMPDPIPVKDTGAGTVSPVDSNVAAHIQEPFDYPRRRAIVACEVCRARKSRCDGAKPKCRLCAELGADCVYREPGHKLDIGDKLILERLAHIEDLIQSGLSQSGLKQAGSPTSPPMSTDTAGGRSRPLTSHGNDVASNIPLPLHGIGTWPANISTIPKSHTTPAMHLLQWPVIRDLVPRSCDPHTLLRLEMDREPLEIMTHPSLDLSNAELYAKSFFDRANVWYAVVNPYTWQTDFREAAADGFRSGVRCCLVLLTLALGQAALEEGGMSGLGQGEPPPGFTFFSAAWTLHNSIVVRNDVLAAQCNVLTAAYLIFIVRPLEAWNHLSNASMKIQLLLSLPASIPKSLRELSERVYWNTLMIESDLLAELDLPHTGIAQFEESMRLPRSFPYDPAALGNVEPPGNDELWYFLAEVALRRLLNRVSHLIYAQKRHIRTPVSSLEPVVHELDLQLSQWYEGLPSQIRFRHEDPAAQSPVQNVLRLRYYACRTIIFRRHVLAVLADESSFYEPGVQDACSKCLEACMGQLESVEAHQCGHLPYLWQGALSVTSQTLLIMGATLCPALASLLPPAHVVHGVIANVLRGVGRSSHLAPSLKLCSDILREAEQRRQEKLRNDCT